MITFKEVKSNPNILEYIKRSTEFLSLYHYTDHGPDHAQLVAGRARKLAEKIGFSKDDQELAEIGAFCHDMGNFLGRKGHESWGALLFQNAFEDKMSATDMVTIMQGIANHDDYYAKIVNPIAAVIVLADKSDVRRNRVKQKDGAVIKNDIHNRVNFAVTDNQFEIDSKNKIITLQLEIDTDFVQVMEYFEIFTQRMVQCRKAAQFLDYKFALVINDFKLL